MQPIITPAEMRAIDAESSTPLDQLVRRAAWHVARQARTLLGGVYGRRVVVIAGPGNNGEDGRVAAEILRRWGVHVVVMEPAVAELPAADLVIDAAYGTGTNRDYQAPALANDAQVLAVDIPSGIEGNTGLACGGPLQATATATFAALKPGLLQGDGPDFAGAVTVCDIGLDVSRAKAWLLDAAFVRQGSDHA